MLLRILRVSTCALLLINAGCGGSSVSRLGLNHNLKAGADSTGGDDELKKLMTDANCLPLQEIVATLSKRTQDTISIYVSNLELKANGDGPFFDDAGTAGAILLRNPKLSLMENISGPDLVHSSLVGQYLNVVGQDCSTVTFAGNGKDTVPTAANTFTVRSATDNIKSKKMVAPRPKNQTEEPTDATPHATAPTGASSSIEMFNSLGAKRSYRDDGSHLLITIEEPHTYMTSDHPGGFKATLRTSFVIVHAATTENLRLTRNLAQLLKAALSAVPKELDAALALATVTAGGAAPATPNGGDATPRTTPNSEFVNINFQTLANIQGKMLLDQYQDNIKSAFPIRVD